MTPNHRSVKYKIVDTLESPKKHILLSSDLTRELIEQYNTEYGNDLEASRVLSLAQIPLGKVYFTEYLNGHVFKFISISLGDDFPEDTFKCVTEKHSTYEDGGFFDLDDDEYKTLVYPRDDTEKGIKAQKCLDAYVFFIERTPQFEIFALEKYNIRINLQSRTLRLDVVSFLVLVDGELRLFISGPVENFDCANLPDVRLFDEIQSENVELLQKISDSYIDIETTQVDAFLNKLTTI